jgi:NAD(P)-dependent dehydrogenase (short-subunit alcohol dehydrogenase family)
MHDTDPRVATRGQTRPIRADDHGETSYQGHGRLQDRVALITGGSTGIGRAVSIAFAREGAHVAIGYLPEGEQEALDTCRWIEAAGRTALRLPGDIRQEEHCTRLVERVVEKFGRLDILVNNAAYSVAYTRPEDFNTADRLCLAALPRMAAGGAIINTASLQALDPSPELLGYATTKAAAANFTKGFSKVAIKRGIRVNAVAPGPVWTPLVRATFPPEQLVAFGRETSVGRAAQPAEIAPVFVFLASDDARFVNGEMYAVTVGSRLTR